MSNIYQYGPILLFLNIKFANPNLLGVLACRQLRQGIWMLTPILDQSLHFTWHNTTGISTSCLLLSMLICACRLKKAVSSKHTYVQSNPYIRPVSQYLVPPSDDIWLDLSQQRRINWCAGDGHSNDLPDIPAGQGQKQSFVSDHMVHYFTNQWQLWRCTLTPKATVLKKNTNKNAFKSFKKKDSPRLRLLSSSILADRFTSRASSSLHPAAKSSTAAWSSWNAFLAWCLKIKLNSSEVRSLELPKCRMQHCDSLCTTPQILQNHATFFWIKAAWSAAPPFSPCLCHVSGRYA